MSADVWNRLVARIASFFGDDSLVVERETTADQVDGWDSVNHIALIVDLEREFGVRFNTGEMAAVENVGQLAERIEAALARR